MANTYNWSILNMSVIPKVDTLSDVVISVVWKCQVQSDTQTTPFITGTQTLNLSQPQGFIQYKDLQESVVVGWVKETLGEATNSIYNNLDELLKEQESPSVINLGLPWNK